MGSFVLNFAKDGNLANQIDVKIVADTEEQHYTLEQIKRIMKEICSKNDLLLTYLKANQGFGGYNYGASTDDSIMLAPFKKGHKGDLFGDYALTEDCLNPTECMFITFFHEFAHCKLTNKVPSVIKGFSWNDTSKFQFELWISMLGIEYAHKNYGIKFSDLAVEWLFESNRTYINYDWKQHSNSLCVKRASAKSYTITGLPKSTFK